MNQNGPTNEIKKLAEYLLGFETDAPIVAQSKSASTYRVCEKLRHPISTLAGSAGFRALLMRSVAVARVECQILKAVRVESDGTLGGLESLSPEEAHEAGPILIAHLLGLLVTFIGSALTIQLVMEQWPDMPVLEPEESQIK